MKKFLNKIFILMVFLSTSLFSYSADRINSESWYVDKYCTGVKEVVNVDGTRTDCLIEQYSIEFDFANKWYECLTQAAHYSLLNKNEASCFLIAESDVDLKYVVRAKRLVSEWGLPITIVVIGPNGIY